MQTSSSQLVRIYERHSREYLDLKTGVDDPYCNGGPIHGGCDANDANEVGGRSPDIRDEWIRLDVRNVRWPSAYEGAIAVRGCPSSLPLHRDWARKSYADHGGETCNHDRQEELRVVGAGSIPPSDDR